MRQAVLERLTSTPEPEKDRGRLACVHARLALTHARHGQLDFARLELSRLRREWTGRELAELSAWLCLTEGVLAWLDALRNVPERQAVANDRLRRARALSIAAPDSEVGPLALAWLADLEMAQGSHQGAIERAREGLTQCRISHHEALSRLALCVADGWMMANAADQASAWYARARSQASQAEDRPTQSEVLHRMAVQRVDALCRGAVSPVCESGRASARVALAMLDSADHYVQMGSLQAVDHHRAQRLEARARLLEWQNRYDATPQMSRPPTAPDPGMLNAFLSRRGLDADSWKPLYEP